jgi:hypothetical protein
MRVGGSKVCKEADPPMAEDNSVLPMFDFYTRYLYLANQA